jgi:hypothetical protein
MYGFHSRDQAAYSGFHAFRSAFHQTGQHFAGGLPRHQTGEKKRRIPLTGESVRVSAVFITGC